MTNEEIAALRDKLPKPTHFRAYARAETLSRRNTNEGRMNVLHDVHDVIAEGQLKNGIASFDAKDAAYVIFLGGKGDEETVVGRLDGPFPDGSANFADIPEEPELADGEVIVDGHTYRKAE